MTSQIIRSSSAQLTKAMNRSYKERSKKLASWPRTLRGKRVESQSISSFSILGLLLVCKNEPWKKSVAQLVSSCGRPPLAQRVQEPRCIQSPWPHFNIIETASHAMLTIRSRSSSHHRSSLVWGPTLTNWDVCR